VHSIADTRTAEQPVTSGNEAETAGLKEAYGEYGLEYAEVRMECPHCHAVYERHGASQPPEPTGEKIAVGLATFDFAAVRTALESRCYNEGLAMLLEYPANTEESYAEEKRELAPLLVGLMVDAPLQEWHDAHEDELRQAVKPFADEAMLDILKRMESIMTGDWEHTYPAAIDLLVPWMMASLTPCTAMAAVPVLQAYCRYVKRSWSKYSLISLNMLLKQAKQMSASEGDRSASWWRRLLRMPTR